MRQSLVLFLLLFVSCSSIPVKRHPASHSLLDASYSELGNQFVVLTSVFWDGFCADDNESQKYWAAHFGFKNAEQQTRKEFSQLRQRFYHPAPYSSKNPFDSPNGLFASNRLDIDPLADAFLSSSELSEAVAKLGPRLSKEDATFLENVFSKYKEALTELTTQSKVFAKAAQDLDVTLQSQDVLSISQFVAYFYKIQSPSPFHIRYAWSPPINKNGGFPSGHFLIITKNPQLHMNQTDDDLTLHEFTHAVSAQQTDAQKKTFTEIFLKGCPKAKTLKKNEILEEPLAVALGQMLYLDTFHPIGYQTTKNWYAGKWVGGFAKQIYPLVKSYYANHRQIDSEFIESIANLCNQWLK